MRRLLFGLTRRGRSLSVVVYIGCLAYPHRVYCLYHLRDVSSPSMLLICISASSVLIICAHSRLLNMMHRAVDPADKFCDVLRTCHGSSGCGNRHGSPKHHPSLPIYYTLSDSRAGLSLEIEATRISQCETAFADVKSLMSS